MRIWKFPDQVVRLGVLFIIAIAVMVVVRQQFVPASFGELGHYRADAVDIEAERELRFAGLQACAECHVDEAEVKAASYHRGLTCEGCHGASRQHVEDPTEHRPLTPQGRESCLRCHAYVSARPTGFPQILEAIHNPMEPCGACHDPHDPTPPEVPGDCSACHAAIANMKGVSHHWSLDCSVCHQARPEHRENPRAHLPSKPTEREFCGGCHATGADSAAEIPRVDLDNHGGRYVCWQCHYPHDPEGP